MAQIYTIALVGTKGGILKSTLTQCIATSNVFMNRYITSIIDADPQGSILSWWDERSRNKDINQSTLLVCNLDSSRPFVEAVQAVKTIELSEEEVENRPMCILFDLPGESQAMTTTRAAMAYCDLCIFPIRSYHKDIVAFDENMRPVLRQILQHRDKKHFAVLPTFAHHGADKDKYRANFSAITEIDVLQNVHVDRQVYTYFSLGGKTLCEYAASSNGEEGLKADKAVEDIERIATEVALKLDRI